jgi:hypothetical protein
MIRKLKALGVAITAVLALSAVAASGAQAFEFTSSNTAKAGHPHEHTISHGTQTTSHVFTAGEGFGGISCAVAEFEGTGTGTDTTVRSLPTYENCKDSFGRTAHVSTNGCEYEFHAKVKVNSDLYTGTSNLLCPTGKSITVEITSSGSVVCTVHIGPQTGISPIKFELGTSQPTDIVVNSEAANVKSTTTGGFFSCGVSEGSHTDGTYTGKTTVTGINTFNEPMDLTIN